MSLEKDLQLLFGDSGFNKADPGSFAQSDGVNISDAELASFTKRGVRFELGKDNIRARAESQGILDKIGNQALKTLAGIPLGVAEMAGYLADFESHANMMKLEGDKIDNWFSEKMRELRGDLDEKLPVYRKDPNKLIDWTDPGFWVENIGNVVESMGEFMAVGVGIGGVLGKAAQGFHNVKKGKTIRRMLAGINKADDIAAQIEKGAALGKRAEGLAQLGTSFGASYLTGIMNGVGVYEKVKEQSMKDGLTEEQANQIAGKAAATTVGITTLTGSVLNMSTVGPIMRGYSKPKPFQNLSKNRLMKDAAEQTDDAYLAQLKKLKNNPKLRKETKKFWQKMAAPESLAREMGQESLEEYSENIAEQAGSIVGGVQDEIDWTSEEALFSAALGAFGGAVGKGFMNSIDRLTGAGSREEHEQALYEQAIDTRIDMIENRDKYLKQYAEATEDPVKAYDALLNLQAQSVMNAIRTGTTEELQHMYEDMLNLDPEEAANLGFKVDEDDVLYYKDIAEQAIKNIKYFERLNNLMANSSIIIPDELKPDYFQNLLLQKFSQDMIDSYDSKIDEDYNSAKTTSERQREIKAYYDEKLANTPEAQKELVKAEMKAALDTKNNIGLPQEIIDLKKIRNRELAFETIAASMRISIDKLRAQGNNKRADKVEKSLIELLSHKDKATKAREQAFTKAGITTLPKLDLDGKIIAREIDKLAHSMTNQRAAERVAKYEDSDWVAEENKRLKDKQHKANVAKTAKENIDRRFNSLFKKFESGANTSISYIKSPDDAQMAIPTEVTTDMTSRQMMELLDEMYEELDNINSEEREAYEQMLQRAEQILDIVRRSEEVQSVDEINDLIDEIMAIAPAGATARTIDRMNELLDDRANWGELYELNQEIKDDMDVVYDNQAISDVFINEDDVIPVYRNKELYLLSIDPNTKEFILENDRGEQEILAGRTSELTLADLGLSMKKDGYYNIDAGVVGDGIVLTIGEYEVPVNTVGDISINTKNGVVDSVTMITTKGREITISNKVLANEIADLALIYRELFNQWMPNRLVAIADKTIDGGKFDYVYDFSGFDPADSSTANNIRIFRNGRELFKGKGIINKATGQLNRKGQIIERLYRSFNKEVLQQTLKNYSKRSDVINTYFNIYWKNEKDTKPKDSPPKPDSRPSIKETIAKDESTGESTVSTEQTEEPELTLTLEKGQEIAESGVTINNVIRGKYQRKVKFTKNGTSWLGVYQKNKGEWKLERLDGKKWIPIKVDPAEARNQMVSAITEDQVTYLENFEPEAKKSNVPKAVPAKETTSKKSDDTVDLNYMRDPAKIAEYNTKAEYLAALKEASEGVFHEDFLQRMADELWDKRDKPVENDKAKENQTSSRIQVLGDGRKVIDVSDGSGVSYRYVYDPKDDTWKMSQKEPSETKFTNLGVPSITAENSARTVLGEDMFNKMSGKSAPKVKSTGNVGTDAMMQAMMGSEIKSTDSKKTKVVKGSKVESGTTIDNIIDGKYQRKIKITTPKGNTILFTYTPNSKDAKWKGESYDGKKWSPLTGVNEQLIDKYIGEDYRQALEENTLTLDKETPADKVKSEVPASKPPKSDNPMIQAILGTEIENNADKTKQDSIVSQDNSSGTVAATEVPQQALPKQVTDIKFKTKGSKLNPNTLPDGKILIGRSGGKEKYVFHKRGRAVVPLMMVTNKRIAYFKDNNVYHVYDRKSGTTQVIGMHQIMAMMNALEKDLKDLDIYEGSLDDVSDIIDSFHKPALTKPVAPAPKYESDAQETAINYWTKTENNEIVPRNPNEGLEYELMHNPGNMLPGDELTFELPDPSEDVWQKHKDGGDAIIFVKWQGKRIGKLFVDNNRRRNPEARTKIQKERQQIYDTLKNGGTVTAKVAPIKVGDNQYNKAIKTSHQGGWFQARDKAGKPVFTPLSAPNGAHRQFVKVGNKWELKDNSVHIVPVVEGKAGGVEFYLDHLVDELSPEDIASIQAHSPNDGEQGQYYITVRTPAGNLAVYKAHTKSLTPNDLNTVVTALSDQSFDRATKAELERIVFLSSENDRMNKNSFLNIEFFDNSPIPAFRFAYEGEFYTLDMNDDFFNAMADDNIEFNVHKIYYTENGVRRGAKVPMKNLKKIVTQILSKKKYNIENSRLEEDSYKEQVGQDLISTDLINDRGNFFSTLHVNMNEFAFNEAKPKTTEKVEPVVEEGDLQEEVTKPVTPTISLFADDYIANNNPNKPNSC